jgi:long-chain acyl-CoA synthetase
MSNVAQAVWARASSDADRVAPRGAREPGTYGRLRERAAAVASRLRAAHVGPGDRVLLVAPAVPEFAGVCFGILAARVGR